MATNPHREFDSKEGQRILREMGVKPFPQPDDLTRPYWEAARRHELCLQRCSDCQRLQHPPEPACKHCGSTGLTWEQLSGEGVVYSFIVDHRLMVPGFKEPYVVAQINPVEAGDDNTVRITTNIRGCELDEVQIGMKVSVAFEDVADDVTLPQFRPSGS